ncbi:F-box domain-containing protein [Colletotrichum salicis]|uniref:F-box domain-containing protein n=1 Tax=Colletotrichum salicis TaxID=1209931 RepID=A0A135UJ07_9PEZI|nr:F-box domain-containing protein [Colletotrichum salicis]
MSAMSFGPGQTLTTVTTDSGDGFPLQQMPNELILEVLHHMDDNNISLLPISMTCRLMRRLSVGMLFRVAQISCAEKDLPDRVREIRRNRPILRAIRTLSIYTESPPASRTPSNFPRIPNVKFNGRPSNATELARMLIALPILEELRLDFRFKATVSLIKPFIRLLKREPGQWSLTHVKALTFPATADLSFIVDAFPHLRALSFEAPLNKPLNSIKGLSEVVNSLGPQLAYVQICKMRWDYNDFQEVASMFPHTTHLTIGGTMAFGGPPTLPNWDLKEATRLLRPMTNLKVLALSDERCRSSLSLDPIVPAHRRASTIATKLLPAIGFHNARSRRTDQAWGIWQNLRLPKLDILYLMDRTFEGHCFVPVKAMVKNKQGQEQEQIVDVKVTDDPQEPAWLDSFGQVKP